MDAEKYNVEESQFVSGDSSPFRIAKHSENQSPNYVKSDLVSNTHNEMRTILGSSASNAITHFNNISKVCSAPYSWLDAARAIPGFSSSDGREKSLSQPWGPLAKSKQTDIQEINSSQQSRGIVHINSGSFSEQAISDSPPRDSKPVEGSKFPIQHKWCGNAKALCEYNTGGIKHWNNRGIKEKLNLENKFDSVFSDENQFYDSVTIDGKHAHLSGDSLHNFRTKLCPEHSAGTDHVADSCPHSHCLTWQRRNPTEFSYSYTLCPDIEFVRKGSKMRLVRRCSKGRLCRFAHSKEEELYHPVVYKTRQCNTYPECTRFYCPFVHSDTKQEIDYGIKEFPQNSGVSNSNKIKIEPQWRKSDWAGMVRDAISRLESDEKRENEEINNINKDKNKSIIHEYINDSPKGRHDNIAKTNSEILGHNYDGNNKLLKHTQKKKDNDLNTINNVQQRPEAIFNQNKKSIENNTFNHFTDEIAGLKPQTVLEQLIFLPSLCSGRPLDGYELSFLVTIVKTLQNSPRDKIQYQMPQVIPANESLGFYESNTRLPSIVDHQNFNNMQIKYNQSNSTFTPNIYDHYCNSGHIKHSPWLSFSTQTDIMPPGFI